jgi:hypothetical protein
VGDYLTRAEVKEVLSNLTSSDDTVIDKYITRATKDINRLTGQFFDTKSAVTRLFDGTGKRTLFLPHNWPLISITTLSVKPGTTGTAVVVPSTDYFLEPAGRDDDEPARYIELTDVPSTGGVNCFTTGKRTVSILGDWGWAVTREDIKEVALEMVTRSWRQRGAGSSDNASGVGLDLDDVSRSLSPRSVAILRNYGYQQPVYS